MEGGRKRLFGSGGIGQGEGSLATHGRPDGLETRRGAVEGGGEVGRGSSGGHGGHLVLVGEEGGGGGGGRQGGQEGLLPALRTGKPLWEGRDANHGGLWLGCLGGWGVWMRHTWFRFAVEATAVLVRAVCGGWMWMRLSNQATAAASNQRAATPFIPSIHRQHTHTHRGGWPWA